MKIAIHPVEESFSSRWIQYCNENKISYKLVNCFDSDIVSTLDDCDALMWHWHQNDYKSALFARQLTLSLEKKGIKVFPNVNTGWHHDDKLGQKYLLEAINAPLVKSYAFYSKEDALNWANKTKYPKVFKLRGGAGSANVSLVKTKKRGRALIQKAFRSGFPAVNKVSRIKERLWILKRDKNVKALKGFIGGLGRILIPNEIEKFSHKEKGYVYFQDFIPKNEFDTRLIVIGNRCFGVRRYCRKGDFRASGSGIKAYNPELFDERCIKIAFDVAKKLGTQTIAFDFIWDKNLPKIVEISYSFIVGPFYDDCPGYWDENLNWCAKEVNPQYFMIEDFVKSLTPMGR